jgi:hypothetical protein
MEISFLFHKITIKALNKFKYTFMGTREVDLRTVSQFSQMFSKVLTIIRVCYPNLKRERAIE